MNEAIRQSSLTDDGRTFAVDKYGHHVVSQNPRMQCSRYVRMREMQWLHKADMTLAQFVGSSGWLPA
jgi:hypothetical protein